MSVVKPTAVSPKITFIAESTEIEKYDLLGERRHWTGCLEIINSDLSLALRKIENRLTQLFNEHECRVKLQKLSVKEITVSELEDDIVWLQAKNQDGLKVLFSINNLMLYTLTEIFLGASKPSNKAQLIQPSESEYRLLQRIFKIQLDALDNQLGYQNEWHLSHTNPPAINKEFISSHIDYTLKEYVSNWQIWYPTTFISSTLSINNDAPNYEQLATKLAKAATNIPTHVNVILAQTQLTIAHLTTLKSGDFIMMDLPEIVSARTGDHVVARGRVVVQSGRLVMQVTNVKD